MKAETLTAPLAASLELSGGSARSGAIVPKVYAAHMRCFRIARAATWPTIDWLIRLWLAQIFFVSGVLKITHWQTALDLAATEYPVSWMSPAAAAYTGVGIELIGGALLAIGFMTRYAAIPMLILSLVIQFNYHAFDNQLFWTALFGWYAIVGAGSFSLDALLRRGLADSALPLAPQVLRATEWIRTHVGPWYLSLVRLWFAIALLAAGARVVDGGVLSRFSDLVANEGAQWFPISTALHCPPMVALLGGVLLFFGIGTRYTAIVLLSIASVSAMLTSGSDDAYLAILFVMFVIQGAGRLAIDPLIAAQVKQRYPQLVGKAAFVVADAPKVVIIGAGFGGLSCANALRDARASVTLIDRANYHLFQPLLYQVATAGISPGDIAAPVRPLFRDAFNTRVLLGTVTGVDTSRQVVTMGDKEVPYDQLVIATGASHSYFGKDQWRPFAPGLKRVEDATEIRRRLLTAFEKAEATDKEEERKSLLTFLIVGGGPTGVELAGAIAELARFGMEKEFRRFDPSTARIVLVQSAPRILPTFSENLAAVAQRSLEKLGVEVLTNSRVENIDADGVMVSGKRIASRCVLWAAGVMASPAAKWLQCAADNAGRIKVGADLSVIGFSNVYAIGDTALSSAWNGQPVPGLAPAAKQGGAYVARVIRSKLGGETLPAPFVYRHLGSLATIGRKSAVADFGFIKLWGAPAWWLWGIIHVGFLVGVRNRLATMVNWFWSYLTLGAGIRLITGEQEHS